jgi:hypothetical protein
VPVEIGRARHGSRREVCTAYPPFVRSAFCVVLGSWIAISCSPDLHRLDGSLEIAVAGVPPAASSIRVVLRGGEAEPFIGEWSSSDSFFVESVPAGALLEVNVEALAEGGVLSSAGARIVAIADRTNHLSLDLGWRPEPPPRSDVVRADPGNVELDRAADPAPVPGPIEELPPESVDSGAIAVVLAHISADQIWNQTLHARVSMGQNASYLAFIAEATRLFGSAPRLITVESAVVELTGGSSVNGLDSLWSSIDLNFELSSETDLAIGSAGVTGSGPLSLSVTAEPATLGAYASDLRAGSFAVELQGPTRRDRMDSFSADARVTLYYRAWAP